MTRSATRVTLTQSVKDSAGRAYGTTCSRGCVLGGKVTGLSMGKDGEKAALRTSEPRDILVVDDDTMLLKLHQDILEDAGYGVHIAWNGTEALNLLDELGSHIGLLIVDQKMGDMSGLDVVRRVREKWPHISFLMVTGFAAADLMLELDRENIMEKPYVIPDLLNRVRKLLS